MQHSNPFQGERERSVAKDLGIPRPGYEYHLRLLTFRFTPKLRGVMCDGYPPRASWVWLAFINFY